VTAVASHTAVRETVDTFRRWLHMDDADSLLATLGTVAANNLDGDPVWLLLVGPPGGGKSEILNSLSGLSFTRSAGTLTEASLLSGTPKKDVGQQARGGLLREIGEFGIIVAKDFGSILSMNRDSQAQTLAALREIYDGAWTRLVGTDGGRSLEWQGKVGFVGGVTPTIDRHHAVMGAMGERFMLYRLPDVDANLQARQALAHAGQERKMRRELSDAVANLIDNQQISREIDEAETDQLIALSTLVVRARSAVERDNYSREIELVPGSEAPTRLTVALKLLLGGLASIGVEKQEAWRVLTKVGLDSVPALRLAIMQTLHQAGGKLSTNVLATAVRHPGTTTRRSCEDLVAHGLLECHRQERGEAHLWELTDFAAERLTTLASGISGTVGAGVPEVLGDPTRPAADLPDQGWGNVSWTPSVGSEKTTTDKTGTAQNGLTEPTTEGVPEMSEQGDTVPESQRGLSYLALPNQIPDISGTPSTRQPVNEFRGNGSTPFDDSEPDPDDLDPGA
jgi:energy-coupling factor transporter ATP-binding protein EcfA2